MLPRATQALRRRLAPALRPLRDLGLWLFYLPQLLLRRPAGHYYYVLQPADRSETVTQGPLCVELALPRSVDAADAVDWCTRQTLGELTAIGYDKSGKALWTADRLGSAKVTEPPVPAPWFAAPSALPEAYPAFLESCLMVAAAERVDAVLLKERLTPLAAPVRTTRELLAPELRRYCLFRRGAYHYDAATDTVEPTPGRRLVKVIDAGGVSEPSERSHDGRFRRGPYLSSATLPPVLRVGVRDVATLERQPVPSTRQPVLVMLSFLAYGGVEHTLFETLRELSDRFDFTLVTLAPHRPELGDRRQDFEQITHRIYSLGDLLHPDAMYGIIVSLLDQTGAKTLFNTNGTTLFYQIAPRLKAERPDIRIIDQLYDHRTGYINWYNNEVFESVDTCVAVNRRIAETLVEDKGWPRQRAPVIWPCGRRRDAFPTPAQAPAIRARIRSELGLRDRDVIFLTAARMNTQKRPVDLVRLAQRVRDLDRVHFLIVGGGELESEVDRAIEAAGVNIRRLDFRSDIPDLVIAADIGCLVSDFEGLPVFMMECFQGGRPFLGTAVGEMGDVLRSTGAGLVVERPGDLDRLEAAVRQLERPELREQLAAKAVEAASMFDPETCARRYGELFAGQL